MKKYYKLLSNRFLVMCAVYVTIFTVIAYSVSLIYTRNILIKNEKSRAEQLTYNINSVLTHGIDIAQVLCTNKSIISYTQNNFDSIFSNYTNIIDIQNQLSALTPQNIMPTSIAVVNFTKNEVVTSNGTESLDFFIRNKKIDYNSTVQKLSQLQKTNKNHYTLEFSNVNEQNPCILSYISYETTYGNPIIIIVLHYIDNFFSTIPQSSLPCIMDITIGKDSVHFTYDEISEKHLDFTQNNIYKCKLVTESTLNTYHWNLISCSLYIPYFTYLLHINNFFFLIVILSLGLFFIGLIYSKRNADKVYRPVQNLIKTLPIDITSNGAGEFEVLEAHLSSLTSQKNIMSDIISHNKKQLEDKFLLQLATSTMSRVQLIDGMTTYNYDNTVLPLQVFILSYRNFFELMEVLSIDGLNEVRTSIHEYFNITYKNSKFFKLLDVDQQTMIIITHTEDSESFINTLKKNILTIEMLFDIDLVVFAGKPSATWHDVSSSYTDALFIKNKCMLTSDQNIIISSENNNNKGIEYSSELENRLISSVLSGNKVLAIENINTIVDTNMNSSFLTREHFTHFVTMLYSTFIRILTHINKTEKDIFDNVKIYLELASCTDSESLKATITEFVSKIISYIVNSQKDVTDDITERMINYIHENYTKDISLFSIAEYMNLSQSYTSRFFKAQTGENFKDYLMNFRLNKAVEIMTETPNIKLANVASAVGLTQKTFYRAFMKKYKTAPSNYIK